MYSKWFIIFVLGSVLCLQGCETAKGFKKDALNTWDGITGKNQESWIRKTDNWMQENMW